MATQPSEIALPFQAPATSGEDNKPFSEMTPEEYEEWDRGFLAALEAGDDSAARASLAAGVPIYYAEDDTPADCVIKKYPDGRRELITLENGQEKLVRSL